MSNWFHRLLNPHCTTCHDEYELLEVCNSCEILKSQLDVTIRERDRLLSKLLDDTPKSMSQQSMEPTKPINIPWNVRRQMLEAEDREKARLIQNAPVPTLISIPTLISTEDLEKELDLVSLGRER